MIVGAAKRYNTSAVVFLAVCSVICLVAFFACLALSQDEARHGGAYLRYMRRAINNFGDEARAAFAKVGVLMASARRTAQALHPTNLHVNKSLFPNDTVQSRMPNPEWLENWLDTQIRFDASWETKVVDRILHNLSLLMNESFKSVQELNRFRKQINAGLT